MLAHSRINIHVHDKNKCGPEKTHSHRPQTDPRHHVEETQNTDTHTTTRTQLHVLKYNNKPSLPQRDGCETRKDVKNCITKQTQNTKHTHARIGSNNKKCNNNNRIVALERLAADAPRRMKGTVRIFYWPNIRPIFCSLTLRL